MSEFADARVRERFSDDYATKPIGRFYMTKNGALHKDGGLYTASYGTGLTELCFDQLHGRPPYRVGGPFFLFRKTEPYQLQGGTTIVGKRITEPNSTTGPIGPGDDFRRCYAGGFVFGGDPGTNLGVEGQVTGPNDHRSSINQNDLADLGGRAYAALRPKIEKANVMEALIEARDVPKMLKTTGKGFADAWKEIQATALEVKPLQVGGNPYRPNNPLVKDKMAPKRAADQFLNTQFGWRPFLRDIGDVYDVITNFHDHVERIKYANDKWMNRRFSEDVVQSEELLYAGLQESGNHCLPYLSDVDYVIPKSGTYTIKRQRITRVWYEGSFKFYEPAFDEGLMSGFPQLQKVSQMVNLLGIRISPSVLYNVTPWSWLVDYFANVGDNIQRWEDMAGNRIVSRYFYLMRHTTYRFEYKNTFSTYDGTQHQLTWYKSAEVKRRMGSNSAFMFSLEDPLNLSPLQAAILAAIGLGGSGGRR